MNNWRTISRQQNKHAMLQLRVSSSCSCSNPTAALAGCSPRPGSATHVTRLRGRRETSWVSVASGSFTLLKPYHCPWSV